MGIDKALEKAKAALKNEEEDLADLQKAAEEMLKILPRVGQGLPPDQHVDAVRDAFKCHQEVRAEAKLRKLRIQGMKAILRSVKRATDKGDLMGLSSTEYQKERSKAMQLGEDAAELMAKGRHKLAQGNPAGAADVLKAASKLQEREGIVQEMAGKDKLIRIFRENA